MPIALPPRRSFDPILQEAWRSGSCVVGRPDRLPRQIGLLLGGFLLAACVADRISAVPTTLILLTPFGFAFALLILALLTYSSQTQIDDKSRVIRTRRGVFGVQRHHLYTFDQIDGAVMDSRSSSRVRTPLNRVWMTANGRRITVVATYSAALAGDFYHYLRHDLQFPEGDEIDLSRLQAVGPWAVAAVGGLLLATGWAMGEAQLHHQGVLEPVMGDALRRNTHNYSRRETDGDHMRVEAYGIGGILLFIGVAATLRRPDSDG